MMFFSESEFTRCFDWRGPTAWTLSFRGASRSLAGIALLGACTPAPPSDSPLSSASSAFCEWEVVSEERLSLTSGAHAYVEPESLTGAETGVLLLGSPTYVFPPSFEGGPPVERDAMVGAVLGPDGSATGVLPPISGVDLNGFSAVDNHDGTWSVGFFVLHPGTRFPADEVALEIGYGLFDGREWLVVETEPVADGIALDPMGASRMVRTGGTLFRALPTRGAGGNAGIGLVRRTGDGWQVTAESPSSVHGLATAHIPGLGVVVAVARPEIRNQTVQGKIIIESMDRRDGAESLVIDAGEGNIWKPVFDSVSDPEWIGWFTDLPAEEGNRTEARAAPLDPSAPVHTRITLDSSSFGLHPLGPLDSGASYWVSDHVAEDRAILVLRAIGSQSEVVFRMPNPFDGPFGAVAMSPSEILLSGPVMGIEDGSLPVTTLLIRLDRRCMPEEG